MKLIKLLAEQMHEELEDAKEYAKLAVQHKEDDRRLAEVYARLSEQELNHSDMLHEQATRIISDYGEEAPAAMQAVWDWEHERMVDCMAAVRVLLDMYRK